MSDPFVYRPPTNFGSGYINQSYSTPQTSPYIPATVLPVSGSPYHSPYQSPYRNSIPLPPSSPNNANRVLFPSTGYDPATTFDPIYSRPRRPSWHGHATTSPYLAATEDPYSRERRRSFGGADPYSPYPYAWAGGAYDAYAATWPNYGGSSYGRASPLQGLPHSPSQFHLHPWLNAEDWRGDFLFDLSSHHFNPAVVVSHTRRPDGSLAIDQTRQAPMDVMMQQATVPGLTRLRVVCELLPKWPIDISYNAQSDGMENPGSIAFRPDPLITSGSHVPPITFLDVLLCIHRSLHTRITQTDWAQLSPVEEEHVSRAYTQRCRALAHSGGFGGGVYGSDAEQAVRNQGVKRVDFLLGKVWFRGCRVDWSDGILRLMVS